MSRFHSWVAVAILVGAVGACGPFCGSGKFNVSNAHTTASSTCPANSNRYSYTTPATVDVDNETSQTVTVKRLQTQWKLLLKHGEWDPSQPVGDSGTLEIAQYSPRSFNAGAKGTLKLAIPWFCTNQGTTTQTYADFSNLLVLTTSAGTFEVSVNTHRMFMG